MNIIQFFREFFIRIYIKIVETLLPDCIFTSYTDVYHPSQSIGNQRVAASSPPACCCKRRAGRSQCQNKAKARAFAYPFLDNSQSLWRNDF